MKIPYIETQRLSLRCPKPADWHNYQSFMQSDRAKYMGGPFDEFSAWGWFCSDIAQWNLYGHGALMIDLKKTGECIGQVGINHGPLFPEQELGWFLYPQAEGNGYAFEAASAIRLWAVEQGILQSLVSYIDPDNRSSCKLAEKLGAVIDTNAEGPDQNDLVYRHPINIL